VVCESRSRAGDADRNIDALHGGSEGDVEDGVDADGIIERYRALIDVVFRSEEYHLTAGDDDAAEHAGIIGCTAEREVGVGAEVLGERSAELDGRRGLNFDIESHAGHEALLPVVRDGGAAACVRMEPKSLWEWSATSSMVTVPVNRLRVVVPVTVRRASARVLTESGYWTRT
jgi:hypothetical protein